MISYFDNSKQSQMTPILSFLSKLIVFFYGVSLTASIFIMIAQINKELYILSKHKVKYNIKTSKELTAEHQTLKYRFFNTQLQQYQKQLQFKNQKKTIELKLSMAITKGNIDNSKILTKTNFIMRTVKSNLFLSILIKKKHFKILTIVLRIFQNHCEQQTEIFSKIRDYEHSSFLKMEIVLQETFLRLAAQL